MSTHHEPWHAAEGDLAAYLAGEGPSVLAASLESHLTSCAACRAFAPR